MACGLDADKILFKIGLSAYRMVLQNCSEKMKKESEVRTCLDQINGYLSQILGASGVPLNYVTHKLVVPDPTVTYPADQVWEEMVARAPHTGTIFPN